MIRLPLLLILATVCVALLGAAMVLAWRDGAREADRLRDEAATHERMDDETLDPDNPAGVRERLCLLAGRTDCDL